MPELSAAPRLAAPQTGQEPRWVLLLTLTATATLGLLASTIYVPSIPAIAAALETSVAKVQLTFVGYLFAFAISMLVLGPLSDRYGRRRTMIFGLLLSVLSSVACAASPSIEFLIGARIVQGIGACAGIVVGRATVRDLYGRAGAAQAIAGLAIAMTLVQSFAPIPGGYIDAWIGWRANFAAVALFAVVALVLALHYVPETRDYDTASSATGAVLAGAVLAGYRTLIGSRRFAAYALTATGSHAGFHIFAAGAPVVLITTLGVAPEYYGYYASLPPIGFLVGSFISNRATQRLGPDMLIAIGSAMLLPAGCIMVTLALLHVASPYMIVGPMIVICCGSGLITPNAVASSLGVSQRSVGAASGLTSFSQMAGAATATAALSLGASGSPMVLATVIAVTGFLGVAAFASVMQLAALPAKIGARAGV